VEVPAVNYQELTSLTPGESSALMRERIVRARARQRERFRRHGRTPCNAGMGAREVQAHCTLSGDARELMRVAMTDLNFSARAYDRILKVSRTIADMGDQDVIQAQHISEAIQYRALDRQNWV
jgi:magnesium chelatase family protein